MGANALLDVSYNGTTYVPETNTGEGSAVPPEWQGWLTHTVQDTPIESPPVERPWLKPHHANPTGSADAYRPPGALLEGGRRKAATGDYEPWVPD